MRLLLRHQAERICGARMRCRFDQEPWAPWGRGQLLLRHLLRLPGPQAVCVPALRPARRPLARLALPRQLACNAWLAVQGANILTTKEGLVKLADFGVAAKVC